MYRYLDYQLKTKFDVPEKTIVFTTGKTLNERFAGYPVRRVFILNNGYTALYENNCITERVAFQNRRSVDFHKRFSLYERGDLKIIEKKVFGNEDKNRLKLKLDEISSRRRTVLKRKELKREKPTKSCYEESDDSAVPPSDCCDTCSSPNHFDNNARRNSRASDFINTQSSRENDDEFCKNSFKFHGNPVKRTWDGRTKSKDVTTDDRFKGYEGGEPIVYSPYRSFRSNYFSRSSYKWRPRPATKEELDEELDRYMAEAKCKTVPTTPINDDVDSFVKEYMLETEKCLNENAEIIEE